MSWRDFEMLVGEGFRLQGYQEAETGARGPDGGVDLVLKRKGETFLVQCKQWRALKVGVSVVRELYGVMAARGAAGGFVVTSGTFTVEAEAFASGRNVKLVDGKKLFGLIQQAKAAQTVGKGGANARAEPVMARTAASRARPAVQRQQATLFRATVDAEEPSRAPMPTSAVPSCPLCDQPMVLRRAKKGCERRSVVLGVLEVSGEPGDEAGSGRGRMNANRAIGRVFGGLLLTALSSAFAQTSTLPAPSRIVFKCVLAEERPPTAMSRARPRCA